MCDLARTTGWAVSLLSGLDALEYRVSCMPRASGSRDAAVFVFCCFSRHDVPARDLLHEGNGCVDRGDPDRRRCHSRETCGTMPQCTDRVGGVAACDANSLHAQPTPQRTDVFIAYRNRSRSLKDATVARVAGAYRMIATTGQERHAQIPWQPDSVARGCAVCQTKLSTYVCHSVCPAMSLSLCLLLTHACTQARLDWCEAPPLPVRSFAFCVTLELLTA